MERLYRKYNYDIDMKSYRVNNINRMIIGYIPDLDKVRTDILIAGYLYSSLIYEDSKDNKENSKKEEK